MTLETDTYVDDAQEMSFWQRQRIALERRIAIDEVRIRAFERMNEDMIRMPLKCVYSLEKYLEDSEIDQQIFLRSQASKAGSASKTDALQRYIIREVENNMKLTVTNLLAKLQNEISCGLIEEIDDCQIHFIDGERSKPAPISGLKDRLSRARKIVRSREPVGANR